MKFHRSRLSKNIIINKKKEKLPLLMTRVCEPHVKPLEEWIYGRLNRIGNSGIITFKNQTAFNGYDGRKLDLCKFFLIKKFFSTYKKYFPKV